MRECERICPVDIPLMLINNKLAKDANHFFGPYEAGMSYVEGQKPALSVYREDDPDDFYRGEKRESIGKRLQSDRLTG